LLERLKQLDTQATALEPARALESGDWSRLLVNGTECTRLECPRFPKVAGRVRLTYLSDKWLPQTRIMDASSGTAARPETVAWVQGACGKPEFHVQAQGFHDKRAFFGLACEKPAVAAPAPGSGPTLNRAPTPEAPVFTQALSAPAPRPIYESKWFWVGAGAVAIAAIAIIAHQNQPHEEREPTTTY
jgi:hypothetical protein